MHLIKIVPHGILADRYPSFEVGASSAADALEGWSRQVGADRSMTVQVLDFDTEEKLRADTDVTELHVVPAMHGGGGVARIAIGALMIVGGILLIPVNPVIASAVIGAGIGMVLGGVMSLFMKSPSVSKEKDPEASKYLGSGKNTAGIGTIIGRGGGRMLIGGHYLSIQVNSNDMVYGSFPVTPT